MPLPLNWAHATWADFHTKFDELIGEKVSLQNTYLTPEEAQRINRAQPIRYTNAANKIGKWWKGLRNSAKNIPVNPNGLHTQAFRTYLNGKTLKKQLSFDLDQALFNVILSGECWVRSDLFLIPNIVLSIVNLFAAGKITWQQKATLSSVIEAQNTFGAFYAYPIVDVSGAFSIYARQWLFPFLHKGFPFLKNNELTDKEKKAFLALVNTLPVSERYFFIFPHQKMNEEESKPSPHNDMRDTSSNLFGLPGHRFLNVKNKTQYEGVLKLSFGAENALGLATYGLRDWFALVPILGAPNINHVDYFGKRMARPMISSDSLSLGILTSVPLTHGSVCALTDVEEHDSYHRYVASQLGEKLHQGVERLIQLSRDTFGMDWSKDLWLLRDFDLGYALRAKVDGKVSKTLMGPNEYGTKYFMAAIITHYLKVQLENCTPEIQESYLRNVLMFTPYNKEIPHSLFPHQIALIFLIDLVKNPKIWLTYNIVGHEAYFEAPYLSLLKMAKYLHEQHYFGEDMKANVLKMEAFVKSQPPLARDPISAVDRILGNYFSSWDQPSEGESAVALKTSTQTLFERIEAELPLYQAHRDNARVFLGFVKAEAKKNKESVSDLNKTNPKKSKIK